MKPNLVHPNLKKKITTVLVPPQEDYWEPAKTGAKSFYQNYIRPNIWIIVVFIIIILILFYRYRITKEKKKLEKQYPQDVNMEEKKENDELVKRVMQEYEKEKERLREPIRKMDSRQTVPPVYSFGAIA